MCCDTEILRPLLVFRQELYQSVLGHRKDSAFELSEAVLCAAGPEPLVRLSLALPFRRSWASAPDALADGSLDAAALRTQFVQALPPAPAGERPLWVLDGSTWPRPRAVTSPERTYGHRVAAGIPQDGVVPGWEYQWLGGRPGADGRLGAPLGPRPPRPGQSEPHRPGPAPGAPRAGGLSGLGPPAPGGAGQRLRCGPTGHRHGAGAGGLPGAPGQAPGLLSCPRALSGARGTPQTRPGLQTQGPRDPGGARPSGEHGRSRLWPGDGQGVAGSACLSGARSALHRGAGPSGAPAAPRPAPGPLVAGLDRGAIAHRPAR